MNLRSSYIYLFMKKANQSPQGLKMIFNIVFFFIFILLITQMSFASEIVLYDGTQSTTPDQQEWFSNFSLETFCNNCKLCVPPICPADLIALCQSDEMDALCNLIPASSTQQAEANVTTLDTTGNMDDMAGYFTSIDPSLIPSGYESILGQFPTSHPDMPELNRSTGFTVNFDVQVLTEEHADSEHGNDRAGFSVIVICKDLKAIELGFWTNEIWAQNDNSESEDLLFTHGEGSMFDTSTELIQYHLEIKDDTYQLYAGEADEAILTGPIRDYTNYDRPFFHNVYKTANFIFLGDDTTSAKANIKLGNVSVNTSEKEKGDMNGNGIGMDDAILVFQVCLGQGDLSSIQDFDLSAVDVDGDQRITLVEFIYILKKLSALIEG